MYAHTHRYAATYLFFYGLGIGEEFFGFGLIALSQTEQVEPSSVLGKTLNCQSHAALNQNRAS